MTDQKKWDFSGYATKVDLKCTDGRTIAMGAFKSSHGKTVPLVWQHFHDTPKNILGKVYLEHRSDGVYAYGEFNSTEAGQDAKLIVQHKDVDSLSIFANQLVQNGSLVKDGVIREVSLVLAGANPGAKIDQVSISHGDGSTSESDEEVLIRMGLPLIIEEEIQHEDSDKSSDDKTVEEVFNTLNEEQKDVVHILISKALEVAASGDESITQNDSEGENNSMKHNVFEGQNDKSETVGLTRQDFAGIVQRSKDSGKSLRHSFNEHVLEHGITNIDVFFPDAQMVGENPAVVSRDMAWVSSFLRGSKHTPFSRIKSRYVDVTADAARAKGYVKGALKLEEVILAFQRVTTPTTVYKKQKLDRDDIVDITEFDVVAWLKSEMRMMLDEEVARAGLISDGRPLTGDADKINETNIRPIYKDSDVYVERVRLTPTEDIEDFIEACIRARENYEGSGSPVMYTTPKTLTDMLLIKDTTHRYIYSNKNELMAKLMVSDIIEVPVMKDVVRTDTAPTPDVDLTLLAIIVNPRDYTFGADKGGQTNFFDDFDIDYNQEKYLYETRLSGALTIPKSAIVVEQEVEAEG